MIADQYRYMVTNPRHWQKLLPLAKVKRIKQAISILQLTFLNDLKQLSNGPCSKRNVYSIAVFTRKLPDLVIMKCVTKICH